MSRTVADRSAPLTIIQHDSTENDNENKTREAHKLWDQAADAPAAHNPNPLTVWMHLLLLDTPRGQELRENCANRKPIQFHP